MTPDKLSDIPRWLCPLCLSGVAEPVVDGWGHCPCSTSQQRLIDQLEKPDPAALADELSAYLRPGARIKGTPMVPLHCRTICLIVEALEATRASQRADKLNPEALGDLYGALKVAKTTIRALHAVGIQKGAEQTMWGIYERGSPEMRAINAALRKAKA